MAIFEDNVELVAEAKRYVDNVGAALSHAGIEPRFDISYEGFGAGGTAGISLTGALDYLDSIARPGHPNARYRKRIRAIEVSVKLPDKVFPRQ